MKAFAYVNPANEKEAVAALKTDGIAMLIGGGQDLLARMKDYIDSAGSRRQRRRGSTPTVTATPDGGLKIGAAVKIVDLVRERPGHAAVSGRRRAPRPKSGRRRFATRARSAATSTSARAAGTTATRSSSASRRAASRCFAVGGENQYHAIFGNEGPSHIVHPSSLAVPFVAYGARFRVVGPNGEREIPAAEYFTLPTMRNVLKENVLGGRRDPDARDPAGAGRGQERALRSPLQAVARLAARVHDRRPDDERQHDPVGARGAGRGGAGAVAIEAGRRARSSASR